MRSCALITSTKSGRLSRPSYTRATQSSRCCGVASIMLHFVQILNLLSPRENQHGQEENERLQLNKSTQERRYVKFHYLAVKFPVTAYITYSGPVKPNGFKTPVIAGINGFLVERYTLYVCWDIKEKFSGLRILLILMLSLPLLCQKTFIQGNEILCLLSGKSLCSGVETSIVPPLTVLVDFYIYSSRMVKESRTFLPPLQFSLDIRTGGEQQCLEQHKF
ncbi:hypothetical protein AVEN_6995-1 [Araneus ventricosus]|uniref:Uncharacterized protein n=1 Tax=Araneus ventricosus TaxID=182803 RepID=A0A4Y2JPS6_ARAVE|nr:hypothetical protein AVEN_6995-1 [Araneus ventricosus]